MEIQFEDEELADLETDAKSVRGKFKPAIARGFRKRLQLIRAAISEADLYAYKGNQFEQLTGNYQGKHSLRLTGNWRLIVQLVERPDNEKILKILEIVDYH